MDERTIGGLRCSQVLEGLDRYMDGLLGPAELTAVTAHVQGCNNCAAFGEAYGRVVHQLRAAVPVELGAGVMARLDARLARERE
ncbi:MAG: hypothetical protein EP330_19990 [Deltaproteobacteria bacterium]|nr:MAG: hypothetical protein EP330_19990 [Deltaproteobacteria bacterium]